ncbi:MAG: polysaccharide pyruvyl transferase family protein [Cellulomonadaceae bacterium]|nr:polysaccharide pyruvyl transferase family protein [Cellulomonadaceae bacterium]
MTKFALYTYSTPNLGDEVQSIAARRFLPQVDYYINRDELGTFSDPDNTDEIKLIANGWYMHSPYQFAPTDPNINPLWVSMYVNRGNDKVQQAMFGPDGLAAMRGPGIPVGARDPETAKLMRSKGLDAYWSGCATLTLQRDERIKKQDFVLACDVSDEVFEFVKSKTDRPVYRISPYFNANLTLEERFATAEWMLSMYQAAHSTVTCRLHCMLPSTAFGTPVALIKTPGNYVARRFAGLESFVRSATQDEYLNNYEFFNVDDPGENPTDFLEKRQSLVDTFSTFTGYDAVDHGIGFSRTNIPELIGNEALMSSIMKFTEPSNKLRKEHVATEKQLKESLSQQEALQQRVDSSFVGKAEIQARRLVRGLRRRVSAK